MRPHLFLLLGLVLPLLPAHAETAPKVYTVNKPGPAVVYQLRGRDNGILEELRVRVGDSVLAGDVVAALDHYRQKHAYETQKRRANNRTALEIAEAEFSEKKSAFREAENQHRRRRISDADLERANSAVRIAQARVTAAQEALEQAQLDLELATRALEDRFIKNPVQGKILSIHRGLGERIQPGDLVVTVGDFTQLSANLTLNKETAAKLAEGSLLAIRTAPEAPVIQALIQSITPAEKSTTGEKVVNVVFDNPDAPPPTPAPSPGTP